MKSQLIDIKEFIPTATFDVVYATPHNFMGFTLYPLPLCLLHKDAAIQLKKVQEDLEKKGLSLKIFDGYRPLSVQQQMWDKIQDERYVSNPAKNKGRHTRGTAVDVTLVDSSGKELLMPTLFDDLSEKAHSDYPHVSEEAKKNRALLKNVMEKHRFMQLPTEWWHFDLEGGGDDIKYPALDVSFTEISK